MADSQIDKLKTKNGSKVLKLKDLFEKYGDSVNYILDIKYTSQRNIEAFTIAVRTYGLEDNIIAASSYFDALRPLDETFPDMTKIYICADQATFDLALDHEYVDMISVPKEIMTADNLKAAHDHDKKFSAWTLNSEEEIREAIDIGVDSYFTDDTALAIKTEQEYRTE
jgi:glycerophosphoryl diester phosphodiesterase